MTIGIYLGKSYQIQRTTGYAAALKYLQKKQEERDNRRELFLIPIVVGMLLVWALVAGLYYAF